jgi:hypothetical protein
LIACGLYGMKRQRWISIVGNLYAGILEGLRRQGFGSAESNAGDLRCERCKKIGSLAQVKEPTAIQTFR